MGFVAIDRDDVPVNGIIARLQRLRQRNDHLGFVLFITFDRTCLDALLLRPRQGDTAKFGFYAL